MISSQAHYRILCSDLNTPKQLSVFFFLCINNNDIFSLSKKLDGVFEMNVMTV